VRRRTKVVLASCAVLVGGAVPTTAHASTTLQPYVVVLKATVDPTTTTNRLQSSFGFTARFVYRAALGGFSAALTDSQVQSVRADSDVSYVSTDMHFSAAGLVQMVAGDAAPAGVQRVRAVQGTSVHQSATSAIAVLDTGIDLANSDLNAVSGKNCISTTSTAKDDNGHGTNVAGIIAARNNGTGVVGTAPGTQLISVKVLDSHASGTLSQILCGIDWVTANAAALNIKVANMSLSGSGSNDNNCGKTNNDAYHQAICRSVAAGVTYVAAAGNNKTAFTKVVPAVYPEVLTATAMSDANGLPGGGAKFTICTTSEKDDTYGSYSNYASTTADQQHTIAAPGTCLQSDKMGGGLSIYTGTSQAAPHAAGAAALCIGSGGSPGPCSGMTPAQIIARLRSDAAAWATTSNGFTGDPLRPITGSYYGYLLNAGAY
jgi:subtilisin